MGDVILIFIILTEINLIYIIMEDLKILFRKLLNKSLDRLKFLILISLTLGCLLGGMWFLIQALISSGLDILVFVLSCVSLWFSIGMIDMFNDFKN